jgi:hypothetical protein
LAKRQGHDEEADEDVADGQRRDEPVLRTGQGSIAADGDDDEDVAEYDEQHDGDDDDR